VKREPNGFGYGFRLDWSADNRKLYVDLPANDVLRWQLAGFLGDHTDDLSVLENSLSIRVRNFPRFKGVTKEWPLYFGLGATGLAYGGLHCLAWNAPFASDTERLLWRLSSVTVASTGFLAVLGALVGSRNYFKLVWKYLSPMVHRAKHIFDPMKRAAPHQIGPWSDISQG
jgi:hypothetical protein